MPFYDYRCNKCDYLFEQFHRVAARIKPTKKPCPQCKKRGSVSQVILSPPSACDPIRVGSVSKADGGFREVISKIKKAHPRNSMRDY